VNLLEGKIHIKYKNKKEAEAIVKAISPDNMKVPSGLYIKTVRNGSEVFTTVNCKKGLKTLIATLDDLLACVSVAEKTFKVVDK
jgi:hypothetical protein